jgi:putative transposase
MLGEFFDPKAELLIYKHCRPHWAQSGAIVFITFRTADSIPREVIDRWEREKHDWLAARGYDAASDWSKTFAKLSAKDRADFQRAIQNPKPKV